MSKKAFIGFRTHSVTVTITESNQVNCFKWSHDRCEYETFNNEADAIEWISTPFAIDYWHMVLEEQ